MDDVESLTAALALERPVLVGHSLGGNLAQALIRRSPHAYSGLAVLDSTWNTGPLKWVEKQMLRLAAPGLASSRRQSSHASWPRLGNNRGRTPGRRAGILTGDEARFPGDLAGDDDARRPGPLVSDAGAALSDSRSRRPHREHRVRNARVGTSRRCERTGGAGRRPPRESGRGRSGDRRVDAIPRGELGHEITSHRRARVP